MKYYYVALVGGDVWYSSPSLARLEEEIKKSQIEFRPYFEKHDLKILCFELKYELDAGRL